MSRNAATVLATVRLVTVRDMHRVLTNDSSWGQPHSFINFKISIRQRRSKLARGEKARPAWSIEHLVGKGVKQLFPNLPYNTLSSWSWNYFLKIYFRSPWINRSCMFGQHFCMGTQEVFLWVLLSEIEYGILRPENCYKKKLRHKLWQSLGTLIRERIIISSHYIYQGIVRLKFSRSIEKSLKTFRKFLVVPRVAVYLIGKNGVTSGHQGVPFKDVLGSQNRRKFQHLPWINESAQSHPHFDSPTPQLNA